MPARDAAVRRDAAGASAQVLRLSDAALFGAVAAAGAAGPPGHAALPRDACAAVAVFPKKDAVPPLACVVAVRRGSVSAPHLCVLLSCEMRFPQRTMKIYG
ncbi:hypothetical protein HY839_01670 [Candidatus Azambacteria bacterium]|nr:hypothetical protein [Candidatus Azambacteria bacterium]